MEWWPRKSGVLIRGVTGTTLEDEEFRCALCRGKGVLPSAKAKCPACGGRGLVRVASPALLCAYCHGRGEVPARSGITCTVCGGKGVVAVPQPVEVCPQCRGTGAAPNSKLPCLVCRGKGVVATNVEGVTTARRGDAEKPRIEGEAEPSPVSLYQVPLAARSHEGDEARVAGYTWSPQRRRGTRMIRPGVIGGLVRRLMATERARILGRKTIDLGRYALEKRAQRWRESSKPFT
jgi:hypothetical protein